MTSTQRALYLAQALRKFSQSAACSAVTEVPSSRFNQLKAVQKKFAVDDGLPVHVKGGFADKFLYQSTVVLTIIGLAWSGELLYKLSFK